MNDWLCANKLTLNLKKTKYLVFQPRQKLNFNLLPPLILAGEILEKASNTKYLQSWTKLLRKVWFWTAITTMTN